MAPPNPGGGVDGMWAAAEDVSVGTVTLFDEDEVPQILIVEDERGISALIETAIQSLGYEATCAFSGEEAVRLLDEDDFDLMILDVMLGQTSEWDVLKEFHRRGLYFRTRVMMLTPRGAELDMMHAWSLGVDEYVTKPFDIDVLIEKVQRLVNSPPVALKLQREAELERSRILALVEGESGEKN
jgi:DNA-binding response OmpR family regulator